MERYGGRFTHLWILDDDTVVAPDAPERLIAAMEQEGASLACPMIVDATGRIGWFPGLLERVPFDAIRTLRTPSEYLERCGNRPIRFSWATGVSLLATRDAFAQLGVHRDDFWIRGEDLEFSLRFSARHPAIFVPDALVRHLPRPLTESPEAMAAERVKHRALIRNAAYISFRLPHGRRIAKNLPGNLWRFFKTWGIGSVPEAIRALWQGAVLGKPAGADQ
jgi:GT2 family glycosyltransferase